MFMPPMRRSPVADHSMVSHVLASAVKPIPESYTPRMKRGTPLSSTRFFASTDTFIVERAAPGTLVTRYAG